MLGKFRFLPKWDAIKSLVDNRGELEQRDRQIEDFVSKLAAMQDTLNALTGIIIGDGAGGFTADAVPLNVANGGTALTSYAIGDIIYASSASVLAKLADVATGSAIISGGITTAPSYGKIGLTTHVSGTLPETSGGTNQTTYATGDLIQATGSNTLGKLSSVATGNALISGGVTTASSWGKIDLTTHISNILGIANGGTGGATGNTGATSFTPSWTNLTTGDATNTGYYWQLGRLMFLQIQWIYGSTSSVTGAVRLTIPNGETARLILGASTVDILDSNVSTNYGGFVETVTSGTQLDIYVHTYNPTSGTNPSYTTKTAVTGTVPMTWTTSDQLRAGILLLLA